MYESLEQQQKQIEGHMRVPLKIESGFRTMETICPSEPILAEGAFSVMGWDDFDAPKALQSILSSFSVYRSDRGELVALLLLTLARDNAVRTSIRKLYYPEVGSAHSDANSDSIAACNRVISVCGFLKELFVLTGPTPDDAQNSRGARKDVLYEDILSAGPSVFKSDEEKDRPLKETFAKAKMHFNHFIKIHDRSLLRREYLLYLASRGIGALCATSRAGIDAFVPFMFKGSMMKPDNVGVILFQFKTTIVTRRQ